MPGKTWKTSFCVWWWGREERRIKVQHRGKKEKILHTRKKCTRQTKKKPERTPTMMYFWLNLILIRFSLGIIERRGWCRRIEFLRKVFFLCYFFFLCLFLFLLLSLSLTFCLSFFYFLSFSLSIFLSIFLSFFCFSLERESK